MMVELEDLPSGPGVPQLTPGDIGDLDLPFFDSNLRRAYLEDTPTLVGSKISTGTSFPSSATSGQLFWRTDSEKFYIYDGTNWIQVGILDSKGHMKIPGRYLKE